MPNDVTSRNKSGRKVSVPSTVEYYDSEGRPVGIGGARRMRKIDEIVEGEVKGRKKAGPKTPRRGK